MDFVYLIVVGVFLTVKLTGVVSQPLDPFTPIEDLFFGALKMMALEEQVEDPPAAAEEEQVEEEHEKAE